MRYHRKVIPGINFVDVIAFHIELNFMIDRLMDGFIYMCGLFYFKDSGCLELIMIA